MRKFPWIICIVSLAAPALAAVATTFFTGPPTFSLNEAGRFHPMGDETYMENWSAFGRTNEGGFIYCVFMVSNAGLGDLNPGFSVAYYAPDGRVYSHDLKFSNKMLQAAQDRFDVRMSKSRYWKEGNSFRVTVPEGPNQLDLTLTPTTSAWRNGNGHVMLGRPTDFWNWIMPMPRGKFSGKLQTAGQTFNLNGYGAIEHIWSNLAYFGFSKNWLSLDLQSEKWSINVMQIALREKFGGQMIRSFYLAEDGQPTRYMNAPQLKLSQWKQAKDYRHPLALDVSGVIDGAQITIQARNGRYGEAVDPLRSLNIVEQKAIRLLVTSPMLYRVVMDAKVTITKNGQIEVTDLTAMSNQLYFEQ